MVADDVPGKRRSARDKAAGKGFRMQLFTGDENSIATLTKGMAKRRSTDPFIINQSNPELLRSRRLLNTHACRVFPNISLQTSGLHWGTDILGQAVVYTPFRLIAKAAAEAIKRFAAGHEVAVPMAGFEGCCLTRIHQPQDRLSRVGLFFSRFLMCLAHATLMQRPSR